MNTVEEIGRMVSPAGADQVVVKVTDPEGASAHFVVSSVYAMFSGPETMVFASDGEGKVNNWDDLWCSRPFNEPGALEYLRDTPLEEIGRRAW